MSKDRFIKINGKEIPVSEDVYFAYKRPAWTERKRQEVRADKDKRGIKAHGKKAGFVGRANRRGRRCQKKCKNSSSIR